MLYRKIQTRIDDWFNKKNNKVLLINGARQVGKTYIIRYCGKKKFANFIEVNLLEDAEHERRFANVHRVEDFYLQLSMIAGNRMQRKEDTLVFLDEIQAYPHLLTLLKFLCEDDRFTYVASGSLLGVTLAQTSSIPIGSISMVEMYPLDFEEFLYANGFGAQAVASLKDSFDNLETLDESTHNNLMDLFKRYLLVGGLPDAVNTWIESHNLLSIRKIQSDIHEFYAADAAKYDKEHRLKIRRIYEMIPSALENKKKRIVIQQIDGVKGKTYQNYADEFEYLINAGIALEVRAVSTPVFPLMENSTKNLIKLYLNDIGILTSLLYHTNANAILNDVSSINLGTVYESVVASELKAHGHRLFYYDNRKKGEVDFLTDDYDTLSVLPVEVKSGKDYYIHKALDGFIANEDYPVKRGLVLSNEREIKEDGGIIYLPVYMAMFI